MSMVTYGSRNGSSRRMSGRRWKSRSILGPRCGSHAAASGAAGARRSHADEPRLAATHRLTSIILPPSSVAGVASPFRNETSSSSMYIKIRTYCLQLYDDKGIQNTVIQGYDRCFELVVTYGRTFGSTWSLTRIRLFLIIEETITKMWHIITC
ncbi:hypothetical protein GQ55_2G058700 [Panicum hallii var. hallii]|uniref:Uncharacterized protein n=1 Tax=Panicum hallii var. hallii TaxID=1504633 RepID=A0A2T7ELV6_9POAL|nr:hypothetical protein GQ55_2G058700 [Panicum hallii var. hallii]